MEARKDNEYKAGLNLTKKRLDDILEHISRLKAGVVGDVCLDVYWEADMQQSELSRETPHHNLPIVRERYSPGAAGNVATCLQALGCQEVYVSSLIGEDWRASLLTKSLCERGIDVTYVLSDPEWGTPSYCKPIRVGLQQVRQEDARLDFLNYKPPSVSLITRLVEQINQMASKLDIIAVTDQLRHGIVVDAVRDCLQQWANKGKIILVDSRDRLHLFRGMIIKPNELEAIHYDGQRRVSQDEPYSLAAWRELAAALTHKAQGACLLTLGDQGSLWAHEGQVSWVPSLRISGPIDIVGAGDSFAASFLAAYGAGCAGEEAMQFAHYGAGITVQKIGTTGSASPDELRQIHQQTALLENNAKGESAHAN